MRLLSLKRNLGIFDRVLRVIVGLALLAFGYLATLNTPSTIAIYVLGIIMLVEGFAGY
ncbi:YgaP family membrane protein [Zhaonella formicivorans]|uniref:YgaP family membrane protein n=1 Tax=Zhaonella formicivorans TaxID=2528593 RepID=UPI001D0FCB6C|nr:DUF2892 domain-containing protein [Zhaonella formicivorans]